MYKFILTFFISLTVQLSYGQTELKNEFDKAKEFLKSEDYTKAVTSFSNVLAKATDDKLKKYCFIYRAFSYNGLNDFKNAITDLDKAIELDPNDLASYTDRGKTKAYANDLDGAKKDFLFILTKDSTGGQAEAAFYYLGKIAYSEGQFGQSIKYYDKLLELAPKDSEAYFNRAVAKGMIMDVAGSIKDYDKAIELNPNYMEAYANRGVAKINLLTSKGNLQPAKEQTRDACAGLKKAKQLGDNTVDDMIFIHCEKK
ncbi:MAG: tetratricopeptide repeat protein [Chitinophagaceae bacterium]|nr:tetratricopeptide repeat protein [Chitinophagaceae bacterium]